VTDIEMKRAFVADLYNGPSWKRRVRGMSDGQVIAIYFREQEKKGEPKKHKKESTDDPPPF
jgi:hypothetical protein